jgi:hypothetical protein
MSDGGDADVANDLLGQRTQLMPATQQLLD